jgi:hypothetical protein
VVDIFNSLSALPYIPYNILVYLARQDGAEDLWKMLKYNSYDALSKPNLSFEEKLKLIWRNGPQEKYGVFLTPLIEDAICESKCVLKIYDYYIHAKELYTSTLVYAFDFLYGGQMSLIEYDGVPVSRGDLFVNIILTVLNGAEVGGIGKLIFYDDMSRYDLARVTIGNSKTFTGIQLFMSVNVGDTGEVNECES